MRILVLGGTRFVGRHVVEALLARGDEITLFHRGNSGAELFEGRVTRVNGDRLADLDKIPSSEFDAVVDTCGYFPRAVSTSTEWAKARGISRYLFVSTISVYHEPNDHANEDAPLIRTGDPENETITPESYGFLKVLCEDVVNSAYGDNAAIVRPGLVVGPYDPSDRFTYWVARLSRQEKVLAPDVVSPTQWIDARDLGNFMAHLLAQKTAGTYHAVGPYPGMPYREFLGKLESTIQKGKLVMAGVDWLNAQDVKPWSDFPLLNSYDSTESGIENLDPSRGIAAGLRYTDLATTIRDTLAWFSTERGDALKFGLADAREAELLGLVESANG